MSIIIDSREPVGKIADILADWTHGTLPDIEFKKLELGDYLVRGDVDILVERKDMADLVGSYQRLKKRMDKMRAKYKYTILLVEGTYQIKNERIWLWRGGTLTDVWGYHTFAKLILQQQLKGSYYLHTCSLEETILNVINLEGAIKPAKKKKV